MNASEILNTFGIISLSIAISMVGFVILTMIFYDYALVRTITIITIPGAAGLVSFIISDIVRGIGTR